MTFHYTEVRRPSAGSVEDEASSRVGSALSPTLATQAFMNAQTAPITSMNSTKTTPFSPQGLRPCNR